MLLLSRASSSTWWRSMKVGSYGTECPTCKHQYKDVVKHGEKHHPYEVKNSTEWRKLLAEIAAGSTAPSSNAAPPKGRRKDKAGKKEGEDQAPPPPPRPSMAEVRHAVWETPQPYRATFHLNTEGRTWDEVNAVAQAVLKDLRLIVKSRKPRIEIDLEQVHERF